MQMKRTEIERKLVGRQMSTEMTADDVGEKCGIKTESWDFPGGSVAGTLCSGCRGPGSVPGQGTESHVSQLKTPCAAAETWRSQMRLKKKKKKNLKKKKKTAQFKPNSNCP